MPDDILHHGVPPLISQASKPACHVFVSQKCAIQFLVGGFQPLWKNISQNGNLPQIGVNIKNIWNHRLDLHVNVPKCQSADWRLCKQRMTLSENRQTLRRKLVLQPSIFRCYCWWKKILHHLGCIKPCKIMENTTKLNWWSPDFWTINSMYSFRKVIRLSSLEIFTAEFLHWGSNSSSRCLSSCSS